MSQQGLNKRLFMAGTCPLRLYNLLNRTVRHLPQSRSAGAIFATSKSLKR